jgi:hypothetical protein
MMLNPVVFAFLKGRLGRPGSDARLRISEPDTLLEFGHLMYMTYWTSRNSVLVAR